MVTKASVSATTARSAKVASAADFTGFALIQGGGGSSSRLALPPSAHPMLCSYRVVEGPGGLAGPTAFWQKRSVNAVTAL